MYRFSQNPSRRETLAVVHKPRSHQLRVELNTILDMRESMSRGAIGTGQAVEYRREIEEESVGLYQY